MISIPILRLSLEAYMMTGQQLAEPDSPTPSDLWYTKLVASSDARCRARARGLAQKGCVAENTTNSCIHQQ